MSMITQNRAGPIDKCVLLFSGGMDSVCYAHLLQPDLLLYIPTGARYEKVESLRIVDLLHHRFLPRESEFLTLGNALDLGRYERDDLIVPNRNAHLLLMASHYGDRLLLSSVEGDRSTDKDAGFYALMVQLLDHMWQEQHWTAARRFSIDAPFKHLTKTELVSLYLERGFPAEALRVSYSCYRGAMRHCGACKPCFRKRVALENCGIHLPDDYYESDFWLTPWFAELKPSILTGQYRGREDADVVSFLTRMRVL